MVFLLLKEKCKTSLSDQKKKLLKSGKKNSRHNRVERLWKIMVQKKGSVAIFQHYNGNVFCFLQLVNLA